MHNLQLPSKPMPHSIILWILRKSQLQRITNQFHHDYAVLLSFEIRYNNMFPNNDPDQQIEIDTSQIQSKQLFCTNKNLFKSVAILLHPDHIRNKSDQEERYNDMIRAACAYHSGDEQELEVLFKKWQSKEDGCYVKESIEIEEWTSELYSFSIKIVQLHRSSMWKLAQKELEYAQEGRDLLSELVTILQNQNT